MNFSDEIYETFDIKTITKYVSKSNKKSIFSFLFIICILAFIAFIGYSQINKSNDDSIDEY